MTTIKADPTPWYANHDEICALAHWLNDRGDFPDVKAVVYFFEKPWKWDTEYQQMQGMNANPPTHGECDCGEITDSKDSHQRWECDGCRNLRENS